MDRSNMELPKAADFEDAPRRIRPRITAQRLAVLALLIVGGVFLGLATEFWPEGGLNNLFRPVRAAFFQNDVEELRSGIRRSLRLGDVRQALLLSDRLIQLDEEAGLLERARVNSIRQNYDKASADLAKVIELNPKNADAIRLRAILHVQQKDFDSALSDATKLAEIEPREGLYLRAKIHREQKDNEKAIADLGQVIEADPAFLEAYVQRFQLYLEKDDYEKALSDAAHIAETSPTNGLVLKGDVFAKQKKYDDSIKAYSEAIDADPRNATAYNNRAYHRALLGRDLDKAANDVEMAIDLAGEEEPAYVDTRGYVAYLKGDFKAALKDFDAAIKGAEAEGISESFSAEIFFHRGLVYRKLGEEKLSEADFAKAKELGFEWKELPEPVGKEL